MYPMRPIYGSCSSSSKVDTSKMDLNTRQEHLISRLQQQIQRVDQLLNDTQGNMSKVNTKQSRSTANFGDDQGSTPAQKLSITWPSSLAYPVDIVVQANPARVPVTPWVLQRLLGKEAVSIRTHTHSTFKGTAPSVENDNSDTNRSVSKKIIFTVIFKDVRETEFMVDPVSQIAVSGEANLFRYVCRTFSIFPQLSAIEETWSDHLVDLIFANVLGGKAKDRQAVLATIDEQLGKRTGRLVCAKLTPADLCLHAALQRTTPSLKDLPGNVLKWQKSVGLAF